MEMDLSQNSINGQYKVQMHFIQLIQVNPSKQFIFYNKVISKMSLKDFTVLQKLGQGSYATVYKVKRLNDSKVYALKQIKLACLDHKAKQNALNEVRLLASLSSPFIITYHEAFIEEPAGLLCIVMEYAEEGDLASLISRNMKSGCIPETEVWKALVNLLEGTQYLHQRSILHRDIKPDNIFICNGVYKLGDLNVSKIKGQGNKLTQTGTPYYASPEVWNDLPYDEKTDIWSIGCAIYEMVCFRPPFSANNLEGLFHQVTTKRHKPIPKFYSVELEDIINKCLEKNPKLRPTAKQLLENWTVKMYQVISTESPSQVSSRSKPGLLKTINFPASQQMKQIKFPKPNYQQQNKQIPTFREPISPIPFKKGSNKENQASLNPQPQSNSPAEVQKLINNTSKVKQRSHERLTGNQTPRNVGQRAIMIQPTHQSDKIKRRSSPRTELSNSKKKGVITAGVQRVRPFIFGNKVQEPRNCHNLIQKKLSKGMKKGIIVQELLKNQQRVLKCLVGRGDRGEQSVLQQRVNKVLSAVRL